MGAVNVKFNRLQEDLSLEEVGGVHLEQSRGKKIHQIVPWRALALVLSLLCLLTIMSLNRRDINYKYVTILDRLSQSDRLQDQYKVDLQKVSRKLNIAWRNLSIIGRVSTFSLGKILMFCVL